MPLDFKNCFLGSTLRGRGRGRPRARGRGRASATVSRAPDNPLDALDYHAVPATPPTPQGRTINILERRNGVELPPRVRVVRAHTGRTMPLGTPNANNPVYVAFLTRQITRCQGCSDLYLQPPTKPYDLVLKTFCQRESPRHGPGGQISHFEKDGYLTNGYFHINDLNCINKKRPGTSEDEIQMTMADYLKLEPNHIAILHALRYLPSIKAKLGL